MHTLVAQMRERKLHVFADELEMILPISGDAQTLMSLAMFMQYDKQVEALGLPDVKNVLKKLGMRPNKGQGLIQLFVKSGKTVGALLWNAIKYYVTKDEKAKQRVKELANTKITAGQVVDVLMRLDKLTLGILSGPLKTIEALTGWSIVPDLKSAIQNIEERAHKALQDLEHAAKRFSGKALKKFQVFVNSLRSLIFKGA